jgi:hypothetical protein
LTMAMADYILHWLNNHNFNDEEYNDAEFILNALENLIQILWYKMLNYSCSRRNQKS